MPGIHVSYALNLQAAGCEAGRKKMDNFCDNITQGSHIAYLAGCQKQGSWNYNSCECHKWCDTFVTQQSDASCKCCFQHTSRWEDRISFYLQNADGIS